MPLRALSTSRLIASSTSSPFHYPIRARVRLGQQVAYRIHCPRAVTIGPPRHHARAVVAHEPDHGRGPGVRRARRLLGARRQHGPSIAVEVASGEVAENAGGTCGADSPAGALLVGAAAAVEGAGSAGSAFVVFSAAVPPGVVGEEPESAFFFTSSVESLYTEIGRA